MPKKTVSAIMSAIFFAVMTTGCGSQVANTTAEVSDASGVEEGLPSGDVTLRVWGSEEEAAIFKHL